MIFKNIERICAEQGKSIRSVELEANLGNGTLSKWDTSSPSVKNLSAVASVLGVDISELLKEEKK